MMKTCAVEVCYLIIYSLQCRWPFQEAVCLPRGALWKGHYCCSTWEATCIITQVSTSLQIWYAAIHLWPSLLLFISSNMCLYHCYMSSYLSFPSMLMRFYVCRPCVLYSDKTVQNSAAVTDDLSKCSIKEVEKPPMDRTSGIPMARLPIQVPQGMQGKNYFILILGFYSMIFKICFYLLNFLSVVVSYWMLTQCLSLSFSFLTLSVTQYFNLPKKKKTIVMAIGWKCNFSSLHVYNILAAKWFLM